MSDSRTRHAELAAQIRSADEAYYVADAPLMSDAAYDALVADYLQRQVGAQADVFPATLTLQRLHGGAPVRGFVRRVLFQEMGAAALLGLGSGAIVGGIPAALHGDVLLGVSVGGAIAAAVLTASSPSIERRNRGAAEAFADVAATMDVASRERFFALVKAPGFAPWFATVTPMEELGHLALGRARCRVGPHRRGRDPGARPARDPAQQQRDPAPRPTRVGPRADR